MTNSHLIVFGKAVAFVSRLLNKGNGSTWPGHIALSSNKHFIKDILSKNPQLTIIVIAGTNGKTTTGKLIQTILEKEGKRVFQNESGANLLSGIASYLLLHANIFGKIDCDFAIFETDEGTLPGVLQELTPTFLVVLNLFRDQLDRYGEINSIAKNWKKAFKNLSESTTLVLNADDPQIAYLGKGVKAKTVYFGLDDKSVTVIHTEHASDSTYCPHCGSKLTYSKVFFSHVGEYECKKCDFKRPQLDISKASHYPLSGIYNRYNTNASVLVTKLLGVSEKTINSSLEGFTPAFGRQEIIEANGRKFQLFLSKNPTSFNQSLRTIMELNPKTILFVLNDQIPDGRDVSWIWDTDIEQYNFENTFVKTSGDRAFDMSLRLKYAHPAIKHVDTHQLLDKELEELMQNHPKDETIYVLPTYSAMLEVRKVLTGKEIL